jgi:sirohydrochlorin ferrochelatase
MGKAGVLVISHGSRDGKWVQLVRETCAGIALPPELADAPVECSFLELVEGDLIQDGIDRLEQAGVTDIIVVPLFVSSGSTHLDEIAWALGLKAEPARPTDLARYRVRARLFMTGPIDDDPEIARLIAGKLRPMSEDPSRELVLLVGHGSDEAGFRERWSRTLDSLSQQVRAIGGYAGADYAMLLPDETAGKMAEWRNRRPDLTVLVAPVFLSEGYFTREAVPRRFAEYPHRYGGWALLPSPLVKEWLARRVAEAWERIGSP